MKRAGHLFERVVGFEELCAAARRAALGTRSRASLRFLFELEPEVLRLQRELEAGSYRPGGYRSFVIRDPKPRRISVAPFRDRVVHHALCAALEPVFERYAMEDSYACRVGKGTQAAVKRVQELARRGGWFAKLDVRHYFETVDHAVLGGALRTRVKDRRVLELADLFIVAGAPGSEPGKGLPIGNLTSQHFANFYLGALDRYVVEELRPRGWSRYMDDILLVFEDRQDVLQARDAASAFLRERLLLEVKSEVTVVDRVGAGVPFLGMRIWPGLIRLDGRRARRFRRRMRSLDLALREGEASEEEVAASAQSMVAWASQADTACFRRSFFSKRLRR